VLNNESSVSDQDPDWIRIGFGFDPGSIRSVDPESESGSGSRRATMAHINRKKVKKFHILQCWMFSFEG
jgi:hypothetical protein